MLGSFLRKAIVAQRSYIGFNNIALEWHLNSVYMAFKGL